MPTISLPNDYNFASPSLIVDIYNATDRLTLKSSGTTGIITANIDKNIRSEDGGTFRLILTPGGPNGVNDPNTWTKIIVPYSFVVISFRRGSSRAIVMMGLITKISESQTWDNRHVTRLIEVQGIDLFLYFRQFAYYVLKFLGLLATLPELFGPAGNVVATTVGAGIVNNHNPNEVGLFWYDNIMMGTDAGDAGIKTPAPGGPRPGVLSNTFINYLGNKQKVRKYFASWFEKYSDDISTDIIIPLAINFIMQEGDFMSKFSQIFPFPFYEFFTLTVPDQINGITLYPNARSSLIKIQSSDPSIPPASSIVIARVNPLPWVNINSSNVGVWKDNRWQALPTYDFTSSSFITSNFNYNANEVKNFYVVAPMSPLTMDGAAPNSTIQGSIQQMGFMYDFYSLTRYGFRPEVDSVMWWADAFGTAAATGTSVGGQIPSPDQFASAISRVASYYEPTPNMLSGIMEIVAWPEIFPGNRFLCKPFKSEDVYLFYIEGVQHIYEFGGTTKTILTLTRGFLQSDYSNSDLMIAAHTGVADRINGKLQLLSSNSVSGLKYATLAQVKFGSGAFDNWVTPGVPSKVI